MNRINTLVGTALLAGSFVGSSALAADETTNKTTTNKADSTQVVPAREDLKPGAAPTVESMDANVQRQHDRDRDGGSAGAGAGAGAGAAAGTDAAAGTGAGGAAAGADAGAGSSAAAGGGSTSAAGGGETRDWAAVDTNSDNLISPEEMEEALKATGPQAGQKR